MPDRLNDVPAFRENRTTGEELRHADDAFAKVRARVFAGDKCLEIGLESLIGDYCV